MAAQVKDKAVKKKFQKSYFDVLGLCCSSEVPLVESILKSLDGVKEYSVIVPTKTVIVIHDDLLISQLQIVKALNQARLEANVRVYGNADYKNKWPSPFAVCSGMFVLLSFIKYLYHPFEWLALGAVAVGIIPIFLKVIASLRNFRIDTNLLVLIAVGGTIALKDYIEAGTIVFLFSIAEWLESRASHKANAVMSSLMSMAPVNAVMAETGEQVNVDEVKLNTLLAVKAGEAIPIDGIVADGKCEVDEKALTGESFPVPKEKDSVVLAGSINLNGFISVKTTAMAEDCVVAKMTKLVEEAQNSKTRTQRFIDKCAQYYIPSVTFISVTLAVIPFAFRLHNKKYWLHLAIVVLVSACPCALVLSTPVATFCALTEAAKVGLLIKGGNFLEILAKIKVIAFDKTGTITRGEFVVTDFQSVSNDISSNTLIYWVSSIESKSSHPMAAALVDYGRSLGIEPKPENVEEFQNFPGEGIHGKIHGKDIYIGNRKIALRAQCRTVPPLEKDRKRGKTVGYIYCGEEPAGIFCLSDACRPGVEDALKELKRLGIKTAMLTGDCPDAAMYAQQQLNKAFEMIHAELLPEDKARIIKEFQQEGSTAMIGDGINDGPALAMADIGISMGVSGSALATETGNVILMSNDIRKVPKAIKLARKCHRKVKENVFLSISTKVAILALAIAGHPLVWAAVLADVGTCLLVIFNSMTLLRGTGKHGAGKCCKSSAAHQTHEHDSCKNSSNDHKKCCSNNNRIDSKNSTSGCQSSHLSLDPCRSNKFTGSTEGQNNGVNEAGHCSHDSCNTVEHDLENNIQHEHGCSGSHNSGSSLKHECRTLLKCEDKCTHNDGAFEVKHCHQECTNTVVHDHFNHSSDSQEHQRSHYPRGCCSKNFGQEPTIIDKKPLQNFDSNCSQSGSVSPCMDSEKMNKHACMSLEKRELGGCCKSYMKECCKEHGHFSAGIGSCLSEIITE